MDRRSFLRRLGLGATVAAAARVLTLDPERQVLLRRPKTIVPLPEDVFRLYSPEDLRALERAAGVLRFYDRSGRARLTTFDASAPRADEALEVLSEQELRMPIEMGHELDPHLSTRTCGHDDRFGAQGRRCSGWAIWVDTRGQVHAHGQGLLDPAVRDRDPYFLMAATTVMTPRGMVTVGH